MAFLHTGLLVHSSTVTAKPHFLYINLQLWAHAYQQGFHCGIDTNNLTESFNNVLRRHYLSHQHDTIIDVLVQVLLEVAFPEQEVRYIQATIKQSGAYRKLRYEIHQFLQDRPQSVRSICLLNIQRGVSIPAGYITQQEPLTLGKFKVKRANTEGNDPWDVDICSGTCSCP